MSKTQNPLIKKNWQEQLAHIGLIAIVICFITAFVTVVGISPVIAADVDTGALDGVMDIVITIISRAALYIGIVIVLWGVFQIVLAFRREDSEGISKQITTVVVGGVLVGFGAIATTLYNTLIA